MGILAQKSHCHIAGQRDLSRVKPVLPLHPLILLALSTYGVRFFNWHWHYLVQVARGRLKHYYVLIKADKTTNVCIVISFEKKNIETCSV